MAGKSTMSHEDVHNTAVLDLATLITTHFKTPKYMLIPSPRLINDAGKGTIVDLGFINRATRQKVLIEVAGCPDNSPLTLAGEHKISQLAWALQLLKPNESYVQMTRPVIQDECFSLQLIHQMAEGDLPTEFAMVKIWHYLFDDTITPVEANFIRSVYIRKLPVMFETFMKQSHIQ